MNEEVWQILRKRGAIRILIELSDHRKGRFTDLVHWAELDHVVLSKRLSDLLKLKLIERRPGFKDKRRCVFYMLTEKGKELARQLETISVREAVKALRLL